MLLPRDHVNQSGQMLLRFAAEYKAKLAIIAGLIESNLPEMAFEQLRQAAVWRRGELEAITRLLIAHEQGMVSHIDAGESDE